MATPTTPTRTSTTCEVDDGNLNYKKGDIASLALKGTHELYLKSPGSLSGLVRGTWSRDFKADDTRRTPLSDEAKDLAVKNWTWLDAWVAKEFQIGDRPAKVKIGNQVMSWGEDIFIYGGVNVTNAIDLRKFHTPGTQLKEVLRPAPMVSFNVGVSDSVSLEGYYQWKWNGFQFDPVGTYFSGADVIGKGARGAYVPTSIDCFLGAGLPYGTVGDPGGAHGFNEGQLADGALDPAFGAAGVGSVAYPRDPQTERLRSIWSGRALQIRRPAKASSASTSCVTTTRCPSLGSSTPAARRTCWGCSTRGLWRQAHCVRRIDEHQRRPR